MIKITEHMHTIIDQLELDITDFITTSPGEFSEHEILKITRKRDYFSGFIAKSSALEKPNSALSLFQEHFLIMHVLHKLSAEMKSRETGYLVFNCGRITIEDYAVDRNHSVCLERHDTNLIEYYLNIENFFIESNNSVNEMLNSFWKQYKRYENLNSKEVDQDFIFFGLNKKCNLNELKQAYKRKMQRAHPDLGGSSEQVVALKQAYDRVSLFLSKN